MDTEIKKDDSVNIIYPKNVLNSDINIMRNQCFIVMSFAKEYDPLYETICNGLKAPYTCLREDRVIKRGIIAADIIYNIKNSHFIIVDISSHSPNVFYELGLAHCFKDTENVILIKENGADDVFDVRGYTVISYSKDKPDELIKTLNEELEKRAPQLILFDILHREGILSYNAKDEKIADSIFIKIASAIPNICQALTIPDVEIGNSEEILNLVYSICPLSCFDNNVQKTRICLQILARLLARFNVTNNDRDEIVSALNEHSHIYQNAPEDVIDSLQTDFVLMYAKHSSSVSPVIDWIMKYFERSKSTNIDLNRHRLEQFLLQTDDQIAMNKIVEGLKGKERHVREHMADIIGARRMQTARKALIAQLSVEDWPFCASSIITALGRLEPSNDSLLAVRTWFAQFKDSLLEQHYHFILKRIVDSVHALDKEGNIAQKYHEKYDETLNKYQKSHPILIRKEIENISQTDEF